MSALTIYILRAITKPAAMDAITKLFDTQTLQYIFIVLGASLLALCAVLVFDSKRAGLSHIPGPFIARYTNLWAVYVAWKTDYAGTRAAFNQTLQQQYGDVVRTGPRNVSVMDPAAIPTIYGVRSRLDKVSEPSERRQGPRRMHADR